MLNSAMNRFELFAGYGNHARFLTAVNAEDWRKARKAFKDAGYKGYHTMVEHDQHHQHISTKEINLH